MKLDPVTKLDKGNILTWKKFDDDIMLPNCDIIILFLIMANLQPSGSRITDAWSIKHKYYIFIDSSLLSNSIWKQN